MLFRVAQPHPYQLADPGLLHRRPVEDIGRLHRPLVVRDDDELRVPSELPQNLRVPPDVGVIQRRVHLVQNHERRWLHLQQREQNRRRRQRPLSTRQLQQIPRLLPGHRNRNIDPAVQHVLRVRQRQFRLAPIEEADEVLLKSLLDRFEGRQKSGGRLPIDLDYRLPNILPRRLQIRSLAGQEFQPLPHPIVLLNRPQIHLPQRRHSPLQFLHSLLRRRAALDGLRRVLRLLQRQPVVLQQRPLPKADLAI